LPAKKDSISLINSSETVCELVVLFFVASLLQW